MFLDVIAPLLECTESSVLIPTAEDRRMNCLSGYILYFHFYLIWLTLLFFLNGLEVLHQRIRTNHITFSSFYLECTCKYYAIQKSQVVSPFSTSHCVCNIPVCAISCVACAQFKNYIFLKIRQHPCRSLKKYPPDNMWFIMAFIQYGFGLV